MRTFLLTLVVTIVLIALFFLPPIYIGDTPLRRVNMLSEVQQLDSAGNIIAEIVQDSIQGIETERFDANAVETEVAYIDSLPEGMTPIEDFGQPRAMLKFYAALNEASSRPVRIAYFGDSFIEGDIITQDLRDMLQSKFGGSGVGFVGITDIAAGFRQSVRTNCSGWTSHNANDGKGKGFKENLQGINGHYFVPSGSNATSHMEGQKSVYPEHLSAWDKTTIFFTPGDGLTLSAAINGGTMEALFSASGNPNYTSETQTITETVTTKVYNEDSTDFHIDTTHVTRTITTTNAVQKEGGLVTKVINGHATKVDLALSNGSGSRVYGMALDGATGISLDNFSMRGSSGFHIETIPADVLSQFAQQRPYDLIVLQFGLNVANEKQKDYSAYANKMAAAVRKLKAAYPSSSILIVSVGDRDKRAADGQLHTMPGIKELIAYQRKMASDLGVAFWDMQQAMGGDGSMARMTENKEANLDYTHINFKGGKHIAKLLFDVLMASSGH